MEMQECTDAGTHACRITRMHTGMKARTHGWKGQRAAFNLPLTWGCDGRRRGRRRRYQQVFLVPHEVVLAVHRELVIFSHEDRPDGTCLFAETAEDATGVVNLVDRGVTGTSLHRSVIFRALEE